MPNSQHEGAGRERAAVSPRARAIAYFVLFGITFVLALLNYALMGHTWGFVLNGVAGFWLGAAFEALEKRPIAPRRGAP